MPNKLNQFGVKFDWYQTEADVVLDVMKRNVTADNCRVTIYEEGAYLRVDVKEEGEDWKPVFDSSLRHPVDPAGYKCACRPSKIEICLHKRVGEQWDSLDNANLQRTDSNVCVSSYPTSSVTHKTTNWDAVEKQAIEEDEKEQLEGDAAVNRLFQQIYRDSNDETKKAMMKSFQESGGTVLSTNWNEVKQGKVDVKPPEGMEYKKYDQ